MFNTDDVLKYKLIEVGSGLALHNTILEAHDIINIYLQYENSNHKLWYYRWNDTSGTIGNKNYDIVKAFVYKCIDCGKIICKPDYIDG